MDIPTTNFYVGAVLATDYSNKLDTSYYRQLNLTKPIPPQNPISAESTVFWFVSATY